MIPLREQELLRLRFQRDLTSRVRIDYFTQKPSSIFIPGRQECAYCEGVQSLLEEIAALGERVALNVHELVREEALAASLGVDKVPGIVIRGRANRPVRFFGMPLGGQFPVFIESLIESAGSTTGLAQEIVRQLRRLKTDVRLQVLVAPACQYSPAVARTALRFALQSVHVKTDVIELTEFPLLAQRFNVRATPTTVIDEKFVIPGSMQEAVLLDNVMRAAEGKPFSGETRVGAATAFTLPSTQQQQQAQPRPVGSSGLVLPR